MEASLSATPSPAHLDPLEEFNLRLEDIIRTFDPTHRDLQGETEAGCDITPAMKTEVAAIADSLSHCSCTQDKLEQLLGRHAHLVTESRERAAACRQLETLCREQQQHYHHLQEETLRRCREDEERRAEMSSHFQVKLTEIQEQIQQHSARNDKLCQENLHLTAKLEGIVAQCELREESLEKMNKRRDLQQQLMEAKLQQADALLADAQEKHKREKEYGPLKDPHLGGELASGELGLYFVQRYELLREAIDKTKKCFAMKEQELAMKKKLLIQAAEWKLQAQTLTEQAAVMQAQLTLYAQKFDEFQATLAKSNEIYCRFKKEMNNMSDKMKKMEKESGIWKSRFENCNKALTDMIQERSEKSQEYDVFVLKIQRLEKLCRALQEERSVLYSKIKEVRHSNSDPTEAEEPVEVAGLTVEEVLKIQGDDPVLTEDMSRLREEQAKLQKFADSLLAMPSDGEEEEESPEQEEQKEEDVVASAFSHFTAKAKEEKPAESQKVLEEPQEVRSHSQAILEEPQEVKGHNQDVLHEPQDVKSHSQEPSAEHAECQQVLEEPPAEPAAAPEVKGHTNEVVKEPQEIMGHSQEVLKEPQEVMDHSQEVLKEPQEVMDHSQELPVAPTVENEPIAAAAAAEEALTKSQPQADQVPPTSASDPNRKQTPKKKKRSTKNAS